MWFVLADALISTLHHVEHHTYLQLPEALRKGLNQASVTHWTQHGHRKLRRVRSTGFAQSDNAAYLGSNVELTQIRKVATIAKDQTSSSPAK
jgi:hypothetical protein